MLPVLPLNPAALAGSATKGPAQLWTAGLPSSAIRLLLLNPFLPHPFTNAITIPFPPTHLDQLNTPAVEFPNSHPFPMVILSSCPTSGWGSTCCFPQFPGAAACPVFTSSNYWITGFGLISLFLLLPSLETALETHSSCRGGWTSFQKRGWVGKATMSAIFPAKISQAAWKHRLLWSLFCN